MLLKEDKKKKIGVPILTLIINEYKNLTFSWNYWYTKNSYSYRFCKMLPKPQNVPFSSYIVFVIRCKVIFISIKALYFE